MTVFRILTAFSAMLLLGLGVASADPSLQAATDDAAQPSTTAPVLVAQADVGAASVTAQADAKVTVDDVVDGLQKYYNDSKNFEAKFKQRYVEVSGNERVSAGLVFFEKPGKMRWDYEKPEEKYLISDGNTFWAWEPTYKQYCKQSMKDVALPSALTFLGGEGEIRDDFNVKLLGTRDGRYQVELKPKTPNPNYAVLEFNVKQDSFRVDQVTIVDALGNENNLYFMDQKFNTSQNSANYTFSPPSDATHMCEPSTKSAGK